MNKERTVSLLATMCLGVLITLWLMLSHLSWSPGKPWPPEPQPYIELEVPEFIEPEEIPLPQQAPGDADAPALTDEPMDNPAKVAPATGTAVENKGPEGTPAPVVSTPKPSPVKVEQKPQPDKPGPVKSAQPEKKEPSAQQTQVKNMFNKAEGLNNANNRTGDDGKAGSPTGKTDSAGPADSKSISSGIRKGSLGGGWQWPGYGRVSSAVTGSVILSFIVDQNGKARKIAVVGGDPPAASNAAVKKRCIDEISRHTFTRSATAPDPDAETPATITFIFK